MWIFWCHPTLYDIKEDTVSLLLLQLPFSCLLELLLKHGIFNSLWQTDFDSAAHKNTGMGDTDSVIILPPERTWMRQKYSIGLLSLIKCLQTIHIISVIKKMCKIRLSSYLLQYLKAKKYKVLIELPSAFNTQLVKRFGEIQFCLERRVGIALPLLQIQMCDWAPGEIQLVLSVSCPMPSLKHTPKSVTNSLALGVLVNQTGHSWEQGGSQAH